MAEKFTLKGEEAQRSLPGIIESIYKISAALKGEEAQRSLPGIIESIYKISAALKGEEAQRSLPGIIESIYKISAALKGEEAQRSLPGIIESIYKIFRAKYFIAHQNEIIQNIKSFSSFGQLKSKVWLMSALKEKRLLSLGCVFLCAGWYGLLPCLLLNDKIFSIGQIFNFEKDFLSVHVSEDLNREFVKDKWKFKAVFKDILELNYQQAQFSVLKANGEAQTLTASPDTIINTSCEHIRSFSKWWSKLPPKKLIILQNNNFFQHSSHVNCVSSLEQFKKQAPMHLLYEGELDLKSYKRFMLIGYKPEKKSAGAKAESTPP